MLSQPPKPNLTEFIKAWNEKYPFDRWWRKRYNAPFGSKLHREQSHIDMAIEYREEVYFKQLDEQRTLDEFKTEKRSLVSKLAARKQLKVVSKQASQAEIDREFDDLDISKFNDPVVVQEK